MSDYAAPAVDPPWDGWDPSKSLTMAAALQDADLERLARMFVGLPQLAVVTFTARRRLADRAPRAALPGRQRRAGPRLATAMWSGRRCR